MCAPNQKLKGAHKCVCQPGWQESEPVCQIVCKTVRVHLCVMMLTHLSHEAVQTPPLSQNCWWPRMHSCRCLLASGHWWSVLSIAVSSGHLRAVGGHLLASAQWGLGNLLLCRGAQYCGLRTPPLLGNCPGWWARTRWGLECRAGVMFLSGQRENKAQ